MMAGLFNLGLGLMNVIDLGAAALNLLRIFASGLFVWVAGTLPLKHTLCSENVAGGNDVSFYSHFIITFFMVETRSLPRNYLVQRIVSPSGPGAHSLLWNLCSTLRRYERCMRQMCGHFPLISCIAIFSINILPITLSTNAQSLH